MKAGYWVDRMACYSVGEKVAEKETTSVALMVEMMDFYLVAASVP